MGFPEHFLTGADGAPQFTKAAFLEAATRQAKDIAKAEDVSIEVARARVWRDNPELKQAYHDAPPAPVPTEAVMVELPGAGVIAKVTKLAASLRAADAERFPTAEIAKVEVWKRNPGLAAQYRAARH